MYQRDIDILEKLKLENYIFTKGEREYLALAVKRLAKYEHKENEWKRTARRSYADTMWM